MVLMFNVFVLLVNRSLNSVAVKWKKGQSGNPARLPARQTA